MAEQQAGWLITLLHGRKLSVCSAVCLDINHAHVCLKSEVHRPPPERLGKVITVHPSSLAQLQRAGPRKKKNR